MLKVWVVSQKHIEIQLGQSQSSPFFLLAQPTSGTVLTSSATLRALDLIDRIAQPSDESNDFGPPPAIALNSRFKFDFDSGDGIDPDKLDFEAIALHEMGHVLGFAQPITKFDHGSDCLDQHEQRLFGKCVGRMPLAIAEKISNQCYLAWRNRWEIL